jgi:type IV pilus assembly protein PilC
MRNLSATLRAGIPLASSLRLLSNEEQKRGGGPCMYLQTSVEKGNTLAGAMELSPYKFPSIIINLIHAGEKSGHLRENIDLANEHLHRSIDLRRKVRAALLYPTFVIIATIVMALAMGNFVLPKLIPLFDSLDVSLPITTRMIIWFAAFFENHGAVFTPSLIIGMIIAVRIAQTKFCRPTVHRLLLYVPLLSSALRATAIAQLTRTLGTLLYSGIPILQGIEIAATSTTNEVYRRAMLSALPVVQAGGTLSQGLRQSKNAMPDMVVTLVEISESTGSLSDTLRFISEFYEEEATYGLNNLTTAMEPVLLLVIGAIVGVFVLSIIMPLYDVTGQV